MPVRARAPKTSEASDPAFGRALVRLVRSLADEKALARIARLIREKRPPAAVVEAIGWFDHRDPSPAWVKFRADFSAAASSVVGGAVAAEKRLLPARAAKAARVPIEVPINPYSLAWIRSSAAEKIVQISETSRANIRRVVERNYAAGARPEAMLAEIKRSIGLTERQSDAVDRRRQLAFDESGSEERADEVADRYAGQQLALRAETIARTETKDAQEQGRQDAWLEARDDGTLPASATRRWSSAPSGPRLCDICAELDDQTTTLDDPFYSEVLGEDVDRPPSHPSCRCTVVLEFA